VHRLFEPLKRADHERNAEGKALEKVRESRLKREHTGYVDMTAWCVISQLLNAFR